MDKQKAILSSHDYDDEWGRPTCISEWGEGESEGKDSFPVRAEPSVSGLVVMAGVGVAMGFACILPKATVASPLDGHGHTSLQIPGREGTPLFRRKVNSVSANSEATQASQASQSPMGEINEASERARIWEQLKHEHREETLWRGFLMPNRGHDATEGLETHRVKRAAGVRKKSMNATIQKLYRLAKRFRRYRKLDWEKHIKAQLSNIDKALTSYVNCDQKSPKERQKARELFEKIKRWRNGYSRHILKQYRFDDLFSRRHPHDKVKNNKKIIRELQKSLPTKVNKTRRRR